MMTAANKKPTAAAVAAVACVSSLCLCVCVPVWIHSTTPERQPLPPDISSRSVGTGVHIEQTVDAILKALAHHTNATTTNTNTDTNTNSDTTDAADADPKQLSSCSSKYTQTLPLCVQPRLLVTILNARPQATFVAWDNTTHLRARLRDADPSLRAILGDAAAVEFHTQAAQALPVLSQRQQQHSSHVRREVLAHVFQTVGSVQTTCTVNLAVYVPACPGSKQRQGAPQEQQHQQHTSRSYWQPGWGGVVLLPQTPCEDHSASDKETADAMPSSSNDSAGKRSRRSTLSAQHALPHFVHFLRNIMGVCPRVHVDDKAALLPREMGAARGVLLERLVTAARDLLLSFSALLDSLPTLVVDKRLAAVAQQACDELHATQLAAESGDWAAALAHARQAHHHAEASAYDPGLLASSLFPEDQKYAVYVPLFVPTGLAILSSWRRLASAYRTVRRR
ncbi:hypothetical protein PTSG_03281 [Salpingoeca rosetta]|uniref:GPI transamidase component PIG-S n=1 Tax=Salpingoeca rosetta (strain ATCC 50818 / BSB-021) TaxID=946362 RepID=F2U4Q9_SALR5|nr:uncharacterized protein PTSG_03281 [Salpingoeca rosetta]EGD82625.1 hypothetical protein PTSG_03281 [Salpingoeca rosetta]|eukprot:XP_004995861.1 hypothetical protein PTSG_03281 [Salpingoeca rosetta]